MSKNKIRVAGEIYVATVMQVTERDSDGSPRMLRLLRDDESVNLAGGEEFLIVYALPRCIARRS